MHVNGSYNAACYINSVFLVSVLSERKKSFNCPTEIYTKFKWIGNLYHYQTVIRSALKISTNIMKANGSTEETK